jgi:ribosomal protein L39E
MSFAKSTISPPCIVESGLCQAERIHASLARPINRVPVTPKWIAENEAKQMACEAKRREWRRLWRRHEQNFADDGC